MCAFVCELCALTLRPSRLTAESSECVHVCVLEYFVTLLSLLFSSYSSYAKFGFKFQLVVVAVVAGIVVPTLAGWLTGLSKSACKCLRMCCAVAVVLCVQRNITITQSSRASRKLLWSAYFVGNE